MSVSSEQLRRFYKSREKKPNLFTYDDEGNLVEKDKEGKLLKIIQLPSYREPTYEERDIMEKKRYESISKIEKEYEYARQELRNKMESSASLSEILRLNNKVSELDMQLQSVRFPLRYVNTIDSIEINKILIDDIYETRKLPYDLHILMTRPFTLNEQYVRIGNIPQKKIQLPQQIQSEKKPVILFSEPDTNEYGFLSPKWTVNFEFNATQYNSVQQAIMAELAKYFDDENNLEAIMLANTPDDIQYSYLDISGDSEINKGKWDQKMKELVLDINLQKFKQFPELAQKLLETKDAQLGYYEPDDNIIGIGISIDNPDAENSSSWSGQNEFGKALEQVRNIIRQDKLQSSQQIQSSLLQKATTVKKRPQIGKF
jgi:ribA/ribD-fused uncharacterized protein